MGVQGYCSQWWLTSEGPSTGDHAGTSSTNQKVGKSGGDALGRGPSALPVAATNFYPLPSRISRCRKSMCRRGPRLESSGPAPRQRRMRSRSAPDGSPVSGFDRGACTVEEGRGPGYGGRRSPVLVPRVDRTPHRRYGRCARGFRPKPCLVVTILGRAGAFVHVAHETGRLPAKRGTERGV